MGHTFSLHQIAEIVMEVEQAGAKFYEQLADQNPDETVKRIFTFLANQEQDHYDVFSNIATESRAKDSPVECESDVIYLFRQSIDNLKNRAF